MSDQIGAKSSSFEEFSQGANAEFRTINHELAAIARKVSDLEYRGPNATAVEEATEANISTLNAGATDSVEDALKLIGSAMSAILGAGGADIDLAPFAALEPFEIPKGNYENYADEVSIVPSSFIEASDAIQLSFDNIDTAAERIAGLLEAVGPEWAGTHRPRVEEAFRDRLGPRTAQLAFDTNARIGAEGGVPHYSAPEDSSVVGVTAGACGAIITTLWAQLNTAQDMDQEIASQVGALTA